MKYNTQVVERYTSVHNCSQMLLNYVKNMNALNNNRSILDLNQYVLIFKISAICGTNAKSADFSITFFPWIGTSHNKVLYTIQKKRMRTLQRY